ncbi:MAG TPA: hypothetical protein VEX86_19535 [Longimicrobium sp.]|nr:hypothetical protein [Longimicrobium sp.]
MCTLILLAFAHVPGAAQDASPPADLRGLGVGPGSRVRLSVPAIAENPLVGHIAGLTADSLLLARGGGARLQIDSREVREMSISVGRARWRWALQGAVVGMLAGGVIGARAAAQGDHAGLESVVGFVAGVIVGTPVGAGVGALAAPERWTPVRLPRPGS